MVQNPASHSTRVVVLRYRIHWTRTGDHHSAAAAVRLTLTPKDPKDCWRQQPWRERYLWRPGSTSRGSRGGRTIRKLAKRGFRTRNGDRTGILCLILPGRIPHNKEGARTAVAGRRLWLRPAPATDSAPDSHRQERYPIFVRVDDDTAGTARRASIHPHLESFPRNKLLTPLYLKLIISDGRVRLC